MNLILRRGLANMGEMAAAAESSRAVSEVARDLEGALGDRALGGVARDHAAGAIAAAMRTLDTIEGDGWPAITGATAARGGWGRLGGEAVAPSSDPSDPVERALA